LAVVLASVASADVSINGPDKISRDTFGEWSLVGEGVDRSTFDWEIIPLDDRSAPDWSRKFATKFTPANDGVLLVGAPGRYELKVLMVGPSGNEQRPFSLTKLKRFIEIEGAIDPVPPGPVDPDKGPDLGRFGLAPKAWLAFKAAGFDKGLSRKIASVFGDVAKEIRDGKFVSTQAAIFAVRDRNAVLIDGRPDEETIRSVLNDLAKQTGAKLTGRDATFENQAIAFGEIQTGILHYTEGGR
jgi:hypothetical protein